MTQTNQLKIEVTVNYLQVILEEKLKILCVLILAFCAGVYIALGKQNIYESEVKVFSNTEKTFDVQNALGGIASIAGINLNSDSKSNIAIEKLQSRVFINGFIKENSLEPLLLAIEKWDENSRNVIFDPMLYDNNKAIWVRDLEKYRTVEPTDIELYEKFKKSLSVVQDKDTGVVVVSFRHQSPDVAKLICEKIVQKINLDMRKADIAEYNRSMEYIKKSLAQVSVVDLKNVLLNIYQEQQKNLMLAELNDDYAYRIIDPAYTPEKKVLPNRMLIVIFALAIGFVISMLIVAVRIQLNAR